MFTNVNDAIYYIEHIKRKEKRENLNRMKKALELLGNPQNAFNSIHVAGTNGKGSTVCYLTNILKEMGYKVGSFISPYVIKFNERIMINMEYISDDDLVKYTNIVKEVCDKIYEQDDDVVTFFEFLTLLDFLYFKEQNVDYAIVEVGMGGILDATNVIDAKCRIITNIGFDHMQALGNTLFEISDKKLGIVHENDTLVTTVKEELYDYFKSYCDSVNANMIYIGNNDTIKSDLTGTTFTYKNKSYKTPLLGVYQAYNAMLAIEAINVIFGDVDASVINNALANSFWPGRLQIMKKNPTILIDGGHNIHGIEAVTDSLKQMTNKKFHTLFCALKDKETDKMIKKLEEISLDFIFTEIDDLRKKDAELLLSETSYKAVVIKNLDEALDYAISLASEENPLLITGSLHFISLVISKIKK